MDAQNIYMMLCDELHIFYFLFRLTVTPGPPLFSLTVQLLDPFPYRVEFIKEIQ